MRARRQVVAGDGASEVGRHRLADGEDQEVAGRDVPTQRAVDAGGTRSEQCTDHDHVDALERDLHGRRERTESRVAPVLGALDAGRAVVLEPAEAGDRHDGDDEPDHDGDRPTDGDLARRRVADREHHAEQRDLTAGTQHLADADGGTHRAEPTGRTEQRLGDRPRGHRHRQHTEHGGEVARRLLGDDVAEHGCDGEQQCRQ